MSKEKYLLIVGCSHATGAEIDGSEDSVYNRDHSFGNLLANKMGRIPINIAMGAMSNGAISRMVINWFENEYNAEVMDVSCLVAWSESTRIDLPVPYVVDYKFAAPAADYYTDINEGFLQINAGWPGGTDWEKSIIPYWHNHQAQQELKCFQDAIINILTTQYYLKNKGIYYLMCNTMKTLPDETGKIDFDMFSDDAVPGETFVRSNNNDNIKFYLDLIDKKSFYEPFNYDKSFYKYYKDLGYKNPKATYWHHGEDAHKDYANLLYNFIK